MIIGTIQSSRFFNGGSSPRVDISSIVPTQDSTQLSVSFTINVSEYCQVPSIENVVLTGTTTKGQILTATPDGFYSPSSYPAATHQYAWYRSSSKQSVGTVIGGATASTYTLVDDDVAAYIRCQVTPVQTGGINNTGVAVTSLYSAVIQDNVFNPYSAITWYTAHRPSGAVNLASNQYWLNEGTGPNSTRTGSDPFPTYNGTQTAVEFTNASSQELTLKLPNPQYSRPVEIWIRTKIKTQVGGWQRLWSFSTDHHLEIRNTGGTFLCGGTTGYTFPTNQWKVIRMVIRAGSNSSTFEVNNGSLVTNTVNASGVLIGSADGHLGSNNSGTGTFADGYISHFLSRHGELSAGEVDDMWDWFNTNAPWQ
jgi:hypothetical protein